MSKKITVETPTKIRVKGREKMIRAGEVIRIDGRRKDFYSAYPIVISADIAEQYFGVEPETNTEETNG